MDEHVVRPSVRFIQGEQGRIAVARSGAEPPLVLPAWWVSHVERDMRDPACGAFFDRLFRSSPLSATTGSAWG
jgi:hypothetical protein